MKPYTEEEKMHNYVEWTKNGLVDAYCNLGNAKSSLKDIAKRHGALSGPYADSLVQTIGAIQYLIETLKEQVEDSIEYYVDEEFPIKEEEE